MTGTLTCSGVAISFTNLKTIDEEAETTPEVNPAKIDESGVEGLNSFGAHEAAKRIAAANNPARTGRARIVFSMMNSFCDLEMRRTGPPPIRRGPADEKNSPSPPAGEGSRQRGVGKIIHIRSGTRGV